MSFVVVAPEVLAAAASDLAGIGSTLAQANAAALAPTTAVLAAGADEVSAAIASLFGAHGQAYQAVSAQMSAFHAQFMQALTGAGGAYAAAEAVNVSAAQSVEQDLLGLRMPGPGLRSAGDQRGRTRHRFGRTRLADSGGTRPP